MHLHLNDAFCHIFSRFEIFPIPFGCSINCPLFVRKGIYNLTREVVSFVVGKRTNKTLKCITNTLILSEAKRIHTDKLRSYRSLIPQSIHKTKQFGTNHIERMNLTLRTHLKRLNRRTICFSKKQKYLEAHLRIYFWG